MRVKTTCVERKHLKKPPSIWNEERERERERERENPHKLPINYLTCRGALGE